jgi:hypothetical protein
VLGDLPQRPLNSTAFITPQQARRPVASSVSRSSGTTFVQSIRSLAPKAGRPSEPASQRLARTRVRTRPAPSQGAGGGRGAPGSAGRRKGPESASLRCGSGGYGCTHGHRLRCWVSRDLEPLAAYMDGGMAPGTGPDLLSPSRRRHQPLPHRLSTHITLHQRILTRWHGQAPSGRLRASYQTPPPG